MLVGLVGEDVNVRILVSDDGAEQQLRTPSQPVERGAADDGDRGDHGRPDGDELEDALLDRDSHHVRDDHWKISVVQSPPWSRTSCARAGLSGRSWKSTKKSGSISMPPLGSHLIRSSQERSSG